MTKHQAAEAFRTLNTLRAARTRLRANERTLYVGLASALKTHGYPDISELLYRSAAIHDKIDVILLDIEQVLGEAAGIPGVRRTTKR
jgi:hypothetical protein